MSLLPIKLQDLSNIVLEKCALLVFALDIKRYMPLCIDYLDEKYLVLLAENFRILGDEGWNFATSEAQKRKLLKTAFKKHMKKGSMYSLNSVFGALDIDGEVKRWDEYGGRPGRFKLVLDFVNKAFDSSLVVRLVKLIEMNKRQAALLDGVEGVKVNIKYDAQICLATTIIAQNEAYIPDYGFNPLIFTDFYGKNGSCFADKNSDSQNDGYWS